MREIRLYGSEGGGAGYSPYPYQKTFEVPLSYAGTQHWIPAFAGMTKYLLCIPGFVQQT